MPLRYYSSDEKNVIRQYFDLPLLKVLRQKTGKDLRYFGLPGEEMLDIKLWSPLINFVHAVERRSKTLEKIEQALITRFPSINAECHLGEIDRVILEDRGKSRNVGGQRKRPRAHTFWCQETRGWAWDFNVINLDYFGPFLPPDIPGVIGRARDRANALRKLFELERQDAWRKWILLVTVEAELVSESDKVHLRNYLASLKTDSSDEVKNIIDFLLAPTPKVYEQVTRLVHGSSAILILIAANNAKLRIWPRGTILYRGAKNQPMIHLIYEFEPTGLPFSPAVSRELVLCTPLLKPKDPPQEPWFELLTEQPPGLSVDRIRACLGFLNPEWINEIGQSLN